MFLRLVCLLLDDISKSGLGNVGVGNSKFRD